MVLEVSEIFSGFAVSDLDAARAFYADKLGLAVHGTPEGGLDIALAGGGRVFVYAKPDFIPATYTVLNLVVADIEAAVDSLVAGGIEMQRYPGLDADDRGIARDPRGPAIAWFTDPAGNILSVLQNRS